MKQSQKLLKEGEVGEILGLQVRTLQRWRFEGHGPQYLKVGGSAVRYPEDALSVWLNKQPVGGDSVQSEARE